jgi:2-oxoglutarate dehydrogenase complex dehydrogenase (E1) component-like enzyme
MACISFGIQGADEFLKRRFSFLYIFSYAFFRPQSNLTLKYYGLDDKSSMIPSAGLINSGNEEMSIEDLVKFLESSYCGTVGIDYQNTEEEEKDWISHRWEELSRISLTTEERVNVCREMLKSQAYDNFLANKFTTLKRYGGEGAESMMAFFLELFHGLGKGKLFAKHHFSACAGQSLIHSILSSIFA